MNLHGQNYFPLHLQSHFLPLHTKRTTLYPTLTTVTVQNITFPQHPRAPVLHLAGYPALSCICKGQGLRKVFFYFSPWFHREVYFIFFYFLFFLLMASPLRHVNEQISNEYIYISTGRNVRNSTPAMPCFVFYFYFFLSPRKIK